MNSSSLVLSESDRLPSPHEGDYTNLCKACKWFIVQSTTRGFFSFFFYNTVDKMRREKARDTETFSNPYTHHHMLFLCHCQQEWSNKTWWNFGIFFLYHKTKSLLSRHIQPLVLFQRKWKKVLFLPAHGKAIVANSTAMQAAECSNGGAPFRTTALTVGLGSMFRQSF